MQMKLPAKHRRARLENVVRSSDSAPALVDASPQLQTDGGCSCLFPTSASKNSSDTCNARFVEGFSETIGARSIHT